MKRYLVERELIQNNIQVLQKKAGSAVIWAVLKGNGYGLGLLPMAETCRAAGLDHFAVTEIAEARALREGGFETGPILMLQPTADADEITALLPLHVIFTISSTEDASVLAGLAAQAGVTAEAHIKIDTGMGRYGFLPEEMEKITPVYHYMDTIHVTGIYTHLHSAFCDRLNRSTACSPRCARRALNRGWRIFSIPPACCIFRARRWTPCASARPCLAASTAGMG